MTDPRRAIPRTDSLLRHPDVSPWVETVGHGRATSVIHAVQARARAGSLDPQDVAGTVADALAGWVEGTAGAPVINATGVIIHTNLGRAPLTDATRAALLDAAGYVPVEFDLPTGQRASRGRSTLQALLDQVPVAQAALTVNNGAAALVLATTALAGGGREVVVSRGEMVEIGDGFRLPDLIESAGARLREVGTTNRTSVADYAEAIGPQTGALLKVHPSNFRVEGFTSAASVAELADLARGHGLPLVVDLGSGLLHPDPILPQEPDATTTLTAGADLVTASGDKLLGGPQAGILLGSTDVVERLRRHPLARAVRTDKVTLAGLEATLRGPASLVHRFLHADPDLLRSRARALADRLVSAGVELTDQPVIAVEGRVGGGGAPGVPLPGWAVALPERYADALRLQRPAVVARLAGGACLLDLRCVLPEQDDALVAAVLAARSTGS